MYKFIVKNCPAIQNLMEWTGEFDNNENPIMTLDTADYCIKNKCECVNVDNCLIKQIADKLNIFFVDMVGKSYDEEEYQAIIAQKLGDIYNLLDIEECK